ncbi:hypothetical protein V5799_010056 [Amblyomma americanum]|uniref:Uncharacterized protein n=1 Tax=Amblyomma americanum TaxID=6943 RepID=A0AAQ4F957_AMBAM
MYASRGQPRLRVQGNSAALSVLPAAGTSRGSSANVLGHRDGAAQEAINGAVASPYPSLSSGSSTSGYDMLKKMLKDVLMGRKSLKRPSSIRDDDSRALITIQFSGR